MIFFYTNPILIAAAVIPAIFLLVHVYRADKLETEPAPLLISLVLYGIAATFIALLLERFGSWLLGRYFPEDSTPYNVLMYFGVVAFSEEGAKYFLLKRRTWRSAAFNCQFDGVVYAVFVALGFALWENISYVLMYGLSTALVRAVTAVPGHACFGVFMGVWYGLAKRLHGQGKDGASKLCRVLALLLPAFQQVHCQQHHRRADQRDGPAREFLLFCRCGRSRIRRSGRGWKIPRGLRCFRLFFCRFMLVELRHVADTGDGFVIRLLLRLAGGDQIVIAVKRMLQDLLPDLRVADGQRGVGEKAVDVGLDLFSHASSSNNACRMRTVSAHSARACR